MVSPYVEKAIPLEYDLGNLAAFDTNPAQIKADDELEESLQAVARDNAQLLLNQILQLPVRRTVDSVNSSSTQDSTMVLFQLPEPTTVLPREKPVPKAKAATRWELFAAKKGINKKAKDGKLVYDEDAQKWVPKWGYGGINKKLDDQWLVEVDEEKEKTDGPIDPRTLKRAERKKLVKKNELQQKRNLKARNA